MSRLKGSGREGRNVGSIGAGKKYDRGPVDAYRNNLGKREVHSVASKKERIALVHNSDSALQRSGVRDFFTSTPFLLFILFLLVASVTLAFVWLASTPTVRMNQPPLHHKPVTYGDIPYQRPQAIH